MIVRVEIEKKGRQGRRGICGYNMHMQSIGIDLVDVVNKRQERRQKWKSQEPQGSPEEYDQ